LACQICGGSGWIVKEVNGKRVSFRCKCQFELSSKIYLKKSGIPKRYINCKFSNFTPQTPYQFRALKECERFFQLFPWTERGLVLYGPPGTGKTHLAVATLKNVIKYKGQKGVFCDFRNLLLTIKSTYDTNESEAEIIETVVKAPLLILDDVGAERNTEWAKEKLNLIINYRYINKLPTIITTNLSFDGGLGERFSSKFDDRTESRIYEMCKIIKVEGNDRRKASSV